MTARSVRIAGGRLSHGPLEVVVSRLGNRYGPRPDLAARVEVLTEPDAPEGWSGTLFGKFGRGANRRWSW